MSEYDEISVCPSLKTSCIYSWEDDSKTSLKSCGIVDDCPFNSLKFVGSKLFWDPDLPSSSLDVLVPRNEKLYFY